MACSKIIALSFFIMFFANGTGAFAAPNTLSDAVLENYNEQSPSFKSYIDLAISLLQNTLKKIKLDSAVTMKEKFLKLEGHSLITCYNPNLVLEVFSEEIAEENKDKLKHIQEGLNLYSCGSKVGNIVLDRWGANIIKTKQNDLLIGKLPYPNTEARWSLRVFGKNKNLQGFIDYQKQDASLKLNIKFFLSNGELYHTFEEYSSPMRINRKYFYGFKNYVFIKMDTFFDLSQNSSQTKFVNFSHEISKTNFLSTMSIIFSELNDDFLSFFWSYN